MVDQDARAGDVIVSEMEGASRQVWNTGGYFREGVCQAFCFLSPEAPANGAIEATIKHIRLPRGSIGQLVVTPHSVSRTSCDVKRISSDYLCLQRQIGNKRIFINGKEHLQQSGDAYLFDVNQEFCQFLLGDRHYKSLSLIIEKRRLFGAIGRAVDVSFVPVQGNNTASSIMHCLSILDQRFDRGSFREIEALFDASFAMLAAFLLQDRGMVEISARNDSRIKRGLFDSIKVYLNDHLGDSQLSPTSVATNFNISIRYVHKLFEESGETLGQYILAQRLEAVSADLRNSLNAAKAISEIATNRGFRDMPSFYRNFKTRYHATPRQRRSAT